MMFFVWRGRRQPPAVEMNYSEDLESEPPPTNLYSLEQILKNGTHLLGGFTFDIIIPHCTPFDGKLLIYVPAIQR